MDIGKRLKELRQKLKISQRELAKRAKMTNGTISMIEKNNVSPSVASLKKILDAFPISMVDFFSPLTGTDEPAWFYKKSELPNITDTGTDSINMFLVGQHFPNPKLTVLHEIYPSQSDTGKEMLQHEGEESGVVIKGSVRITVDNQTRVLKKGDAYYFSSKLPHRFENISKQNCEIISVCSARTF